MDNPIAVWFIDNSFWIFVGIGILLTFATYIWGGPIFKKWEEESKRQEIERTAQEIYARECRAAELTKRLEELRKGRCP